MNLEQIFKDKSIKAKEKITIIGDWVLKDELPLDELLIFAESQKSPVKGSCIEAVEYATKINPSIADENLFIYVTESLKNDEPRVKWESAKVIANTAKNFTSLLENAVNNLLKNTKNDGTVVRWATAFALAEILKIKTEHNATLLPVIETLMEKEENNGVKKKYLDGLKKVKR